MSRCIDQSRRAGIVGLACAGVALVAVGCAGDAGGGSDGDGPTQITIASQAQPTAFSMWLADDLGYYDDVDLSVDFQIAESGGALLASGAAGDWQVGYMGGPPLLSGYDSWGLLPAGAMLSENRNIILFMDRDVLDGAEPAEALASTPVGVVPNSVSSQMLYACADSMGVAADDVEVVPLEPPAIANAMVGNDVDAAVLFSTNNSPLVADPDKYVQVCNGDDAGVSLVDPYVVTPRFWESNPDAAAAWVDATFRANEWIIETPQDEVMAKFMEYFDAVGIEVTRAEAEYAFEVRQWITLEDALAQMQEGEFGSGLTETAQFLEAAGVYDEMPDVDTMTSDGLEIVEAAAAHREGQ